MKRSFLPTLIYLAILALAFLLFLLPLPHGWSAGWRGELTNRLHAPLMAICMITATRLLRRHLPPISSLLLAVSAAVALAALIEWVQPCFGRTSSLVDFLWGMAGILGGCLWQVATLPNSTTARLTAYVLAMVCALAPPMQWWFQVWLVHAEAQRLFPTLAQSSRPDMHLLWTIEPAQDEDRERGTCILLKRDANHPGSIHLDTLDRDWRDFAGLEISGTLQADSPVEVGLRLDVGQNGTGRIRAGGWMQPGSHAIQIAWPRDADRHLVHQLVVFLQANPVAAQLEIHHLRLIRHQQGKLLDAGTRNSGAKKIPSAGLQ